MSSQHQFNKKYHLGEPSEFIAALIRESMNEDVDWMWAANQAANPVDRAYCLAYAVQTQPENRAARRALEIQLDALRRRNRTPNPPRRPHHLWEFVTTWVRA